MMKATRLVKEKKMNYQEVLFHVYVKLVPLEYVV